MKKKNIWDKIYSYTTGNSRYIIYHIPIVKNIIPKHIREQYKIRKESVNLVCSFLGKCKECGCKTPNLHFADQACEGLCYPDFLSKEKFKDLKNNKPVKENGVYWKINKGRFNYTSHE